MRTWEDNIKTDFREIKSEGVDWVNLVQVRDYFKDLVNTAVNHLML
jgi:hypothetical protein